jgi:hypothetical protein
VSDVSEFVTKTRNVVNSFRVQVRRLGEVDSLSKSKVTTVHPHHTVEMSVFDQVVRTRDPILILSHFL